MNSVNVLSGKKFKAIIESVRQRLQYVISKRYLQHIKLALNTVGGNTTMSEFTFDFDMKDGSKIYWHEIIHRSREDGKVTAEQYFNS